MKRILHSTQRFFQRRFHQKMAARVDRTPVDPRIRFPCYCSFDGLIDVTGFRALLPSLEEGIRCFRRQEPEVMFDAGPYRIGNKDQSSTATGVPLTVPTKELDYFELNCPEFWQESPNAAYFQALMDWIPCLPMKYTARIMLIFETPGHAAAPHRDHCDTSVSHEFIWLRNPAKRFYCMDHQTGERKFIESNSAWFDTVHQYHGTEPSNELSFSIRVDGCFSDEIRKQMPENRYSPASTASLWASVSNLETMESHF